MFEFNWFLAVIFNKKLVSVQCQGLCWELGCINKLILQIKISYRFTYKKMLIIQKKDVQRCNTLGLSEVLVLILVIADRT